MSKKKQHLYYKLIEPTDLVQGGPIYTGMPLYIEFFDGSGTHCKLIEIADGNAKVDCDFFDDIATPEYYALSYKFFHVVDRHALNYTLTEMTNL